MKTKAIRAESSEKRAPNARRSAREGMTPNTAFDAPRASEFAFRDNRPAAAQRNLQQSIDTSPRQRAQAARVSESFGLPLQKFEDEEALQTVADPAVAQGAAIDEDETLQGRFDPDSAPAQREADAPVAENRTGMPAQLKADLEGLSGMDLSDVRVHRDSPKPAQMNALAYAQGNDIHLGSGQQEHLPHEAWHVVQQRQGRVRPTIQMAGIQVNDEEGLEREADLMGRKASLMHSPKLKTTGPNTEITNEGRRREVSGGTSSTIRSPVVQGVFSKMARAALKFLRIDENSQTAVLLKDQINKIAKYYPEDEVPFAIKQLIEDTEANPLLMGAGFAASATKPLLRPQPAILNARVERFLGSGARSFAQKGLTKLAGEGANAMVHHAVPSISALIATGQMIHSVASADVLEEIALKACEYRDPIGIAMVRLAMYRKDKQIANIVKLPTKLVPLIGSFVGNFMGKAVDSILKPNEKALDMTPLHAAEAVANAARDGNGWAANFLMNGLKIKRDLFPERGLVKLVCEILEIPTG